jgi:asparaginyl-tRNA synthetase
MVKPKIVLLKHIKRNVGKPITLKGWVFNLRSSGKICFLQFRDGTGYIQAVGIKSSLGDKLFNQLNSLTFESSIELIGIAKQDKRSPYGYELEIADARVINLASPDYPIGKKEHGVGFLLDHRHLWLRSPKQQAILKIRNTIVKSIYQYFEANDFIEIDTPIFTPIACEGTTTLFEVDYFGNTVYLSQSGQLYLEAVLPAFNRVFDFNPVFRSEKSKTRRHLTEFWMTNAEAAFVDHSQNLTIQEQLVHHIIKTVLEKNRSELILLERDISKLEAIKIPFPRLTHSKAIKKLQKLGSLIKSRDDLGAEDETILTQQYNQPIFVTHYPAEIKAFYMKRNNKDNSLAECADLLAPEGYGEIIGGSQREDDSNTLLQSIKDHKLDQSDLSWYLDTRKYGSVPHSGFGLGLERIVAWICDLKHVRETIPFPRTIYRTRP